MPNYNERVASKIQINHPSLLLHTHSSLHWVMFAGNILLLMLFSVKRRIWMSRRSRLIVNIDRFILVIRFGSQRSIRVLCRPAHFLLWSHSYKNQEERCDSHYFKCYFDNSTDERPFLIRQHQYLLKNITCVIQIWWKLTTESDDASCLHAHDQIFGTLNPGVEWLWNRPADIAHIPMTTTETAIIKPAFRAAIRFAHLTDFRYDKRTTFGLAGR